MASSPSTAGQFLDLCKGSQLFEPGHLERFVRGQPLPANATLTAERLVQAGLLTPFQAKQLLLGRNQNFLLGPYKVLEQIGQGGMGTVFLAEHTALLLEARRCADKVLVEDPQLGTLERVAKILGQLIHFERRIRLARARHDCEPLSLCGASTHSPRNSHLVLLAVDLL